MKVTMLQSKALLLAAMVTCLWVSIVQPELAGQTIEFAEQISGFENGFSDGTPFQGDPEITIEERMKHYGVPGVCVAVVQDHKVIWSKGYGVMDRKTGQAVTTDTLFQCASISKPVSAAAALKMVELGKFQLDTDINTYLKSWKLPSNEFTGEQPVTLRHLTSHTGGLTVHGFLGYSEGLSVPTLIQVLNGESPANSAAVRVDKVPGGSMRYSGGGYCVMQQMMIDAYDGKLFPAIMEELVLGPAGMTNCSYSQPLPEIQRKAVATGYLPDGTRVSGGQHTYPELAPAGLYASAPKLAKFFIEIQLAKHGKSNRVLSKKMAQEMLTPVDGRFGLGIGVQDRAGELYMGHGGWNEGFSSEANFHQDRGYGVVVLTNGNHPDFVEEAVASVARVHQWHNYVLPKYEKLAINEKHIEKVSGRYDHSGNLVKVFAENGKLKVSASGSEPIEVFRVGEDEYACRTMDDLFCFASDDSGVQTLSFKRPWEDADPSNVAKRLGDDEKLPVEWVLAGDFDKALAGYKKLKETDPDSSIVNEDRLNAFGYQLVANKQLDEALVVFRINTKLYPKAFNTFDSLGEIYLMLGNKELGILNYKKSLELNPANNNAKEVLGKLKSGA